VCFTLDQDASGSSGACSCTQRGHEVEEFAEARPNLKLAIVVLALAAALPCVPVIVGMTAQSGIPEALPTWLNLFGIGAIVAKWASIAYGIGRYSTV
jgi:hypothetical protein